MRNKCLFSLGLVFVISLTSMVAFAFSFVGTPADELDSRDIIVQSMISDEANATPTATSVATTAPEQETEKAERSKIGSMDWDSDDAYRLAKIAMAEAESEDTEGKALVMLVVLNRVWSDEFPDTIEDVIFQKGQFSPISNIDVWEARRGTLLDEYYLCGEDMTREDAKKAVRERSGVERFAKPRKGCGVYALIMDSNAFFYERFMVDVDTICFNCHKPIKGKAKDFPSITADNGVKYHFCSYDCRMVVQRKINPYSEGEFQEREGYENNGGVYGYIYHIYNRSTNMHYIGQTVYMPFFRWQEHVKSGLKGDITDLIFETITEVRVKSQEYLNNIEAWWIQKYIHDYGRENVMNITTPKITMEDLIKEFDMQVIGQMRFAEVENG